MSSPACLPEASSLVFTSSSHARPVVPAHYADLLERTHPGLLGSLEHPRIEALDSSVEDVGEAIRGAKAFYQAQGLEEGELDHEQVRLGDALAIVHCRKTATPLLAGWLLLTISHGPRDQRQRLAVPVRREA